MSPLVKDYVDSVCMVNDYTVIISILDGYEVEDTQFSNSIQNKFSVTFITSLYFIFQK